MSLDYLKPQDFYEFLLDFLIVLFRYQILVQEVFRSVLDPLWENQENDFIRKCKNCYIQYNYFGMNEKLHCPCCDNLMDVNYDELADD